MKNFFFLYYIIHCYLCSFDFKILSIYRLQKLFKVNSLVHFNTSLRFFNFVFHWRVCLLFILFWMQFDWLLMFMWFNVCYCNMQRYSTFAAVCLKKKEKRENSIYKIKKIFKVTLNNWPFVVTIIHTIYVAYSYFNYTSECREWDRMPLIAGACQ